VHQEPQVQLVQLDLRELPEPQVQLDLLVLVEQLDLQASQEQLVQPVLVSQSKVQWPQ
jgi:hypothetical protein